MSTGVYIPCQAGTEGVLHCCLGHLGRHESEIAEIVVLCAWADTGVEAVCREHGVGFWSAERKLPHGPLLDAWLAHAGADLFVSLDSDCLVLRDHWTEVLAGMVRSGAFAAGALGIYGPPQEVPTGAARRILERRCWNRTRVWCQMMESSRLRWAASRGVGFASGEDTGIGLVDAFCRLGMRCEGWRPTRCPVPQGEADPELNRHCCVVFGDHVCHLGGASRERSDGEVNALAPYEWARERILRTGSAEWLLTESHRYGHDREHELHRQEVEAVFRVPYEVACRYPVADAGCDLGYTGGRKKVGG